MTDESNVELFNADSETYDSNVRFDLLEQYTL